MPIKALIKPDMTIKKKGKRMFVTGRYHYTVNHFKT